MESRIAQKKRWAILKAILLKWSRSSKIRDCNPRVWGRPRTKYIGRSSQMDLLVRNMEGEYSPIFWLGPLKFGNETTFNKFSDMFVSLLLFGFCYKGTTLPRFFFLNLIFSIWIAYYFFFKFYFSLILFWCYIYTIRITIFWSRRYMNISIDIFIKKSCVLDVLASFLRN